MTKEELIQRLQDIEWDDFEVKEAKNELPKNVWETVSAFSNTSGGWIILGIKQHGKLFEIQGVDNAEKLEQDFLGTLRSQKFNIRLSASATHYNIGEKKILAFHVSSSPHKPVYFGNPSNTFIRMGSGDQRATDSEIMAMYHDQSFGIRSELIVPETDMPQNVVVSSRDVIGNVVVNSQDVIGNVVVNPLDRLQTILNMLKQDNTLSAAQIAEKLSMNIRTIQRDLTKLKQRGMINHVEPDKGGYWEILI